MIGEHTWPRCFLVLENRVGCNSQYFAISRARRLAYHGGCWLVSMKPRNSSTGDASSQLCFWVPPELNLGLGIFLVGTESGARLGNLGVAWRRSAGARSQQKRSAGATSKWSAGGSTLKGLGLNGFISSPASISGRTGPVSSGEMPQRTCRINSSKS